MEVYKGIRTYACTVHDVTINISEHIVRMYVLRMCYVRT